MTTGTWQWRASGRAVGAVAAVAVALLAAPLSASAASGGTISFVGGITAPPLQISAGPAVSAMRVGAAHAQAVRQGTGVALTFNSSPGVVSGADVALHVVDVAQSRGAGVAAHFVDSGGRLAAAHGGHYRVGRDGGVLSLSPDRTGSATPVIVVVSYD
jgi:hypothetical protein